jgi:hypothetical protein
MTLSITYAGSERAGRVLLEGGIASLTTAADGTFATSGVRIEDPDGVLDLRQLQPFIVEESDCAQPRCFTGFMYDVKISRGPYRNGPGRIWELEIVDLNFLLHLRVLRGAAANRPKETGSDRLTWLLSTVGMAGVVFDNGFVMANAWSYDETDYRGKYADDVLSDIVTAATAGRWVFFVYWDDSATPGEEVSLFYGEAVSAINDSTLRISNVLSDVDDTVTFWPYQESSLDASGDAIYDGVYISYVGGTLYRQLGSTYTEFGIHRDGVYESDRNNNLTSASLHADTFLTTHAAQVDTITCVIRLPSDKVNLIQAGMRLSVRFEHIPHYDTFTWTRVTRRTLTLTAGRNDFYDVQLELSTSGINQGGGGDPGDFPHAPCSGATGSLIQFVGGAGTLVLGATPTPGHILTHTAARRNAGPGPEINTDFTLLDTGTNGPDSWAVSYRIVEVGDGTSWPDLSNGVLAEWDAVSVGAFVSASNQGLATPMTCGGSLTPGNGLAGVVIGAAAIGQSDFDPVPEVTPYPGVTEVTEFKHGGGAEHPICWLGYEIVSSASGAYVSGGTITNALSTPVNTNYWGGCTFFLVTCDESDNPPMPGQTVYRETIGVGDGVTTTFTTSHPYADGSLTLLVDLLDQTGAVTSFDGATGDVTLGFAPAVGELVQATYQGR